MDKKPSFILHKDSCEIETKLTDEQLGQLFRAIIRHQQGKQIEQLSDKVDMAFFPFLQQFKRDDKTYKKNSEKNAKNGSLGGRPSKGLKPSGLIGLLDKPKKAYSESDSESKNDSKNKKESESEKNTPTQNFDLKKEIEISLREQSIEIEGLDKMESFIFIPPDKRTLLIAKGMTDEEIAKYANEANASIEACLYPSEKVNRNAYLDSLNNGNAYITVEKFWKWKKENEEKQAEKTLTDDQIALKMAGFPY